ncbi:MAG: hypothetical protein QY327_04710 [Fimbriimonadaceae bacterium]|nr:MAG: hypothetical protein QY327_04710 [Fimbriimonadaceae bacterium]
MKRGPLGSFLAGALLSGLLCFAFLSDNDSLSDARSLSESWWVLPSSHDIPRSEIARVLSICFAEIERGRGSQEVYKLAIFCCEELGAEGEVDRLKRWMKEATERRTTMMLGNGTTRKYQFDNRGQLTTQIEFSGATPLCTIVDGYDSVGNRLTRSLDGNPVTWSYDDLYRLTGQQKAGQVCTYTLDGVGNLEVMWEGGNFPKTFTFNAADRLVTMVEGADLTTYAWTGYGALESEITGNSTTGYAYNGQDQLAVVTAPSGDKTTYSFDGDGLRRSVATTNQSQDPPTLDVTTMVWDGIDYLFLNEPTQNRVVLTLEGEIVSCGSKDLLTDPLGSLVKEISSGASLGSLIEMYPYGTLVGTRGKPSTPFLYVAAYGYYYDSIDRDYVRARELYKKLGRWMQTDPLWPIEGPYLYCDGDPVSRLDPTGLFQIDYVNCDGTEPGHIESALRFLCGRLGILKSCLDDYTCKPLGIEAGTALEDICNGSWKGNPIIVHCASRWNPLCRGWGGPKKCGFAWGKDGISICPDAFNDPECGPLWCTVLHELFHFFGYLHQSKIFPCLDLIPSCGERISGD